MAIGYGILHDLVTAHLCIEYFTIGHPKIIQSESPIALAFFWGTIATWWVGLPMGTLIACFSQLGKYPKLTFREAIQMILQLILVMFSLALIAGIIGFTLTEVRIIQLTPRLSDIIEPAQHSKFLAAGWAHGASYLIGIIGTAVLCRKIHVKRKRHSTQ
ncbi:MAG: hypothetical protein MK066_08550 [Crocinitomicaceae bacterium]|nr:hypothetical protein [Crocinitomicaceae bacterium]